MPMVLVIFARTGRFKLRGRRVRGFGRGLAALERLVGKVRSSLARARS
jgi:hypothetical protein